MPETKSTSPPSFERLMDWLLGSLDKGIDKCKVLPNEALWIAEQDKEERFVHVQFTDWNNTPLINPLVWRIKDWRISDSRERAIKLRHEKERREYNLWHENTEVLAKRLMKEIGFTYEQALEFASEAAKRKHVNIAAGFGFTNMEVE